MVQLFMLMCTEVEHLPYIESVTLCEKQCHFKVPFIDIPYYLFLCNFVFCVTLFSRNLVEYLRANIIVTDFKFCVFHVWRQNGSDSVPASSHTPEYMDSSQHRLCSVNWLTNHMIPMPVSLRWHLPLSTRCNIRVLKWLLDGLK